MKAIVTEIQVGGLVIVCSLEEACRRYLELIAGEVPHRTKISFAIQLPSGEKRQITIRDEDYEVVAYGSFEGLPSFLDYALEVKKDVMSQGN